EIGEVVDLFLKGEMSHRRPSGCDPVPADTVGPIAGDGEPVLLPECAGEEAAHRMRLPSTHRHQVCQCRARLPPEQFDYGCTLCTVSKDRICGSIFTRVDVLADLRNGLCHGRTSDRLAGRSNIRQLGGFRYSDGC